MAVALSTPMSSADRSILATVATPTKNTRATFASPSDASTRTNSPTGSSSSSENDNSLAESANITGALALRRGLRAAILSDLGLDISSDGAHANSPATGAETTSSSDSRVSPASIVRTCPTRGPSMIATGRTPQPKTPLGDASQRSPPVGSAQRRNGGWCAGLDASQRSPGSALQLQSGSTPTTSILGTCLGDASQRSPTGRSAAVPARSGNSPKSAPQPSPVSPLCIASAVGNQAQFIAPCGDATRRVPAQVSTVSIMSSCAACSNRDSPSSQPDADSLSMWVSSVFGTSLSQSELERALRAAAPETYED